MSTLTLMSKRIFKHTLLALLLSIVALAPHSKATPQRFGNVELDLVSENLSLQKGQSGWLALKFSIDPDWHLYWKNPGDAGLPPSAKWTLPEGFTVGELQFPTPEVLLTPPLTSFSYSNDLVLLTKVTAPATFDPDSVTISAKVSWLICKEQCIPGKGEVAITLPVSTESPKADASLSKLFANAKFALPLKLPEWTFSAFRDNGFVTLLMTKPGAATEKHSPHLLPLQEGYFDYSVPQKIARSGDTIAVTLAVSKQAAEIPSTLSGILTSEENWRGPGSEAGLWFESNIVEGTPPEFAATSGVGSRSISPLTAVLYSFLGGLILNLMPCVLPVLSLKILGLVKQAGEDKSRLFKHGLVFTLGVLISFWVLAVLLLLFRAGGEQLGWGFQLQSPTFVVVVSVFMFLFGLNLLGVFEIGTGLASLGGRTAGSGTHYGGSFLNGVTATVVATPCTAPFMGAALGFALTQSVWLSLLIFTSLGLGMSAPYLLLSLSPKLLAFIPKPGRWMESLKQFMGFLLLATVLWLAFVLVGQAGALSVIWLFVGLLLVSIGAWAYGRWGHIAATVRSRAIATTVALTLVASGLLFSLSQIGSVQTSSLTSANAHAGEGLKWQQYSEKTLQELRAQNKPVFIDFTADWCLSCKVNEGFVLNSAAVVKRFEELDITPLKADWTNRDTAISQALSSYGRTSVPLYVLYIPNKEEPILLPEILTQSIVLNTLNTIESGRS